MEKPAVALDARLTSQMSVGMKAYARELTARLPHVAPDLRFVPFTQGANFSLDEQVRLPLAVVRSGASLTHYLSLYAPVLAPRPYVVTVHDLIHLRFPQYFKARVRPYYDIVVRRLCKRAARVITDDERTVADLQQFLGVDPGRVRVIPLGAGDVFFKPAPPYRGDRPYLLYVGNHRAHKDLPTMLRAWTDLPNDVAADVYITGPDDLQPLRERFARAQGSIIALGDIDDAQLASYYAGAAALVHPALCEGFGLPMLEAMAQGCPVVACSEAVPGVLHDAALTFAPGDWRAACTNVERLLSDESLRAELQARGRSLAAPLTWDRCAAQTAQVYRELVRD